MSIEPEQTHCDTLGCTATRREVNHWFAVRVEAGKVVHIYTWKHAEQAKLLKKCRHFCGVAHALKYASEALGDKTISTEVTTEARET